MKIRNGFVSNSSSSSFIATYGIVRDEEQYNKWMDSCGYKTQYETMTGVELVELQGKGRYDKPICGGFYDMIDVDTVYTKAKENPDSIFVYSSECGPHDDGDFWDDGIGEYDYDIELNSFYDHQIELYKSSVERNGVEVISQTYYAGRNG